jgi:hypothetical protein
MIDRETARLLAQKAVHHLIHPDLCTETREGWFFPYDDEFGVTGSAGVIVHKWSGRALVLGSHPAFTLERDLRAYDEGFQFKVYDLVILEISDRQKTIDVLARVGPAVVVPEYEHGAVWRIPRRLSRDEIEGRLDKLPVVFPEVRLWTCVEALQEARDRGYFQFEAREFRGPRTG